MKLFDSHAHMNDVKFDEDRNEVISNCFTSDISYFVEIGYSEITSRQAVELAQKYGVSGDVQRAPRKKQQIESVD